jgi:hypothetical protein
MITLCQWVFDALFNCASVIYAQNMSHKDEEMHMLDISEILQRHK